MHATGMNGIEKGRKKDQKSNRQQQGEAAEQWVQDETRREGNKRKSLRETSSNEDNKNIIY